MKGWTRVSERTHVPRRHFLYQILLTTALASLMQRTVNAQVPFVAGFDRFSRHGEIDAVASGRLLISELSCTACHATESESLLPKLGPNLHDAGNRLNTAWIQRYLMAPQQSKPGTTMPDVLSGLPVTEKQRVVDALVSFLSRQTKPFPELKAGGATPVPSRFWNRGNVKHGRRLYHQIGCVACHDADKDYDVAEMKPSPIDQLLRQLDPEDIADMGLASAARKVQSVPHANLAAKYTAQSLTFFLLNPDAQRPGGRMPNFGLGPVEAADIAAWLISRDQSKPIPQSDSGSESTGLVEKGERLFREFRCVNCHAIGQVEPAEQAIPLNKIRLSEKPTCLDVAAPGLPHYGLDTQQTESINAALTEKLVMTAQDQLNLTLLQLNCGGCHKRNKRGGVGRFRRPYFETAGNVDIGDEGRLPPPLTGVGKKLTASWLANVLKGKAAVRRHLHVRMPRFSQAAARRLPALFVQTDQVTKRQSEEDVFGSTNDLAEPGRALMNVGCVQCHAFKGESLPGTIGTDLVGVTQRIQPQWFHDFLLNPVKLKAGTRMPTFFPNGRSQNKDILGGNTEKQIAALWTYLKNIEKLALPQKIQEVRDRNFELTPQDRPIILRTFMPVAGTHAIAVGLPQKVHFAFDAENVRYAQAWRGRFLDAEGTWFSRFTPPAEPVGHAAVTLPSGVSFAYLESEDSEWPSNGEAAGYRFDGYRLNKAGSPTFLYRIGQTRFEDTMNARKDGELTRTIRIFRHSDADQQLMLRAHTGIKLEKTAETAQTDQSGLTVSADGDLQDTGRIRSGGGIMEWLLIVAKTPEPEIEVQYRW